MPRLAAFPKAWLDPLCMDGSLKLEQWIELSATLDVDGLEFYAGFLDLKEARRWPEFRKRVEDQGRSIPMLCCSPDFTHPDPAERLRQIEQEKRWIELAAALGGGGSYCRVLSGQRYPELSVEEGVRRAAEAIAACAEFAQTLGVRLILENHYKSELAAVGFDGWISIEDGVEGMEQMRNSVAFLRGKMARHWR